MYSGLPREDASSLSAARGGLMEEDDLRLTDEGDRERDALLHPAREEAAGNIIIEAMISSLPIITCDTVGFASFVKKYNAGCVLEGIFDQNLFNKLLEELIARDIDSIKKGMENLKEEDYFYSRFRFIGDSVQAYFNEQ